MKTMKLVNISSSQYDRAEAVAFFHAVVAPVIIGIVAYAIHIDIFVTTFSYVLLMALVNLHRGFSGDAFLEQKGDMYFGNLKYLFIFCAFIACLLLGLGGVHV